MAAVATQPEGLESEQISHWMDRYGADLRRHLTGMPGAEDDAEDVLQSMWISAYRTPPDAGPGSNLKGWLFRVATNAALDRLGRDRRRRAALNGRAVELLPDEPAAPDHAVWSLGASARTDSGTLRPASPETARGRVAPLGGGPRLRDDRA